MDEEAGKCKPNRVAMICATMGHAPTINLALAFDRPVFMDVAFADVFGLA